MNGVINPESGDSFSVILAKLLSDGTDGVLHLIDTTTGKKAMVRITGGRVSESVIGAAEGEEALSVMAALDGWWFRFQATPVVEAKPAKEPGNTPFTLPGAKTKPTGPPTVTPVATVAVPQPEPKPEPKSSVLEEGWTRFTSINGELTGNGVSEEDAAFYTADVAFFREQARRIGASLGLFAPRVMAMVEPDRVGTAYWEESPWILRGLVAPGGVGLARLLANRTTSN